jgi:hypothetical protein
MISCPSNIALTPSLASKRQKIAETVLGPKVVSRLIGFALFLLGGKREHIASETGMPLNSFLSFLTRMNRLGVDGFRDRRCSAMKTLSPSLMRIKIVHQENGIYLRLLPTTAELLLRPENVDQNRVVVLTLSASGLLSSLQAGELLQVSPGYIPALCRKLTAGDVSAVLDKRMGQQQDYRVTEQMKAELIVQWSANVAVGKSCSSSALNASLQERCGIKLPERTIRYHLKKLGLMSKVKELSCLITSIKKGS